MTATPCGCDAYQKVLRDPQYLDAKRAFQVAQAAGDAAMQAHARSTMQGFVRMEQDALEDAHRWKCPRVGYPEHCKVTLDPERQATLQEVNRLCDTSFTGCPNATLHQPWVARALRAYDWQKHLRGNLSDLETPTEILVDAVLEISRGVNAREQREFDERQKQLKNRTP